MVVRGPDARSWLQGQLSQDIATLAIGEGAESLVLSPEGRVVVYCRASMLGDDVVLLDMQTGYAQVLADRLRRFRLRVKAELEIGAVPCLQVRGPASFARLEAGGLRVAVPGSCPPAGGSEDSWVLAARVDWPAFSGVDVLAPQGEAALGGLDLAMGDPAAFEVARIEAGVPAMAHELDGRTIAHEASSLVEHTVSFNKGCYTGQELVARIDARGARVAHRLCGVVVDAPWEQAAGAILSSAGRNVGRVTSSAWSPGFGQPVCLAYVHRDVALLSRVRLMPGEYSGEIRQLPLSIG